MTKPEQKQLRYDSCVVRVLGTGTTELVFSYTILPGDEDIADGIT